MLRTEHCNRQVLKYNTSYHALWCSIKITPRPLAPVKTTRLAYPVPHTRTVAPIDDPTHESKLSNISGRCEVREMGSREKAIFLALIWGRAGTARPPPVAAQNSFFFPCF